jgi:putative transposase
VFGLLSLIINPVRFSKVAVIIRPSTLLRFHQALVKKKYQQLFSSRQYSKPGPKGPSQELIDAIVEMKKRNSRFGCPRIAQEINKAFGVDIDKDVIRRVLEKHYRPEPDSGHGPSWLTFIGQLKDSLWSIDLFRCESILFNTHWVLVAMDQFTRRIIGFGVHAGDVDGMALCRMFNQIKQDQPTYLSTDNDPLFHYRQWQANLRIYEINEIKSIPFTPQSHPFIERLIGTVRRKYLDHTLFWNRHDLQKKTRHIQRVLQRLSHPCRLRWQNTVANDL